MRGSSLTLELRNKGVNIRFQSGDIGTGQCCKSEAKSENDVKSRGMFRRPLQDGFTIDSFRWRIRPCKSVLG